MLSFFSVSVSVSRYSSVVLVIGNVIVIVIVIESLSSLVLLLLELLCQKLRSAIHTPNEIDDHKRPRRHVHLPGCPPNVLQHVVRAPSAPSPGDTRALHARHTLRGRLRYGKPV